MNTFETIHSASAASSDITSAKKGRRTSELASTTSDDQAAEIGSHQRYTRGPHESTSAAGTSPVAMAMIHTVTCSGSMMAAATSHRPSHLPTR